MTFDPLGDPSFYPMLEAQAQYAHAAANTFYEMTAEFPQITEHLQRLEQIEHDADDLIHAIVNKVNKQADTPIDKADLHGLTDRLDDTVDGIEGAAARIGLYRLALPRPDLQPLVGLLVAITRENSRIIGQLRYGFYQDEIAAVIAGVHAMETRSDRAFRQAISDLFADNGLDIRLLIQWKDVYERIESAVNRCEKLAGFVENLLVKYT
jgi:uncharacterized protein Yka (UPF0111/DUF47 family)